MNVRDKVLAAIPWGEDAALPTRDIFDSLGMDHREIRRVIMRAFDTGEVKRDSQLRLYRPYPR